MTIGARWLKNDIDDTELAALLTRDLDYKAQLITIKMDRRINDSVTFKTSMRLPSGLHRDPNSSLLARDAALIAALTFRY